MKNFILCTLSVFLLYSCTTDGYKINGYASSLPDGTKIYITSLDENFTLLDSAIVEDGRFTFSGSKDTAAVCMMVADGFLEGGPFVLENGDIAVKLGSVFRRKGTMQNDAMQEFYNMQSAMFKRMENVVERYSNADEKSINLRDSIAAEVESAELDFWGKSIELMLDNINNAAGAFILMQIGDELTPVTMKNLMERVPEYNRNAFFDAMYNRVNADADRVERAAKTAIGNSYIGFELPDAAGKQVLFNSIVENSRYTLLNIWAGWSAQSVNEFTELKKIYRKYSSKGVSLVSLSIDEDLQEWRSAVDSIAAPWYQLCDPEGSVDVATAYGVGVIPTAILIDGRGNIVARDYPAYRMLQLLDALMNE